MASTWFVRGGGKVYGPIDAARLKQLVADKKIDEQTDVAQSNAGPWVPAGRVRGLFAETTATTKPSQISHATAASPYATSDTSFADAPTHVAATGTFPSDGPQSFGEWYGGTVGGWNVVLQILAWLFGGYFLIPMWWAFSARASFSARRSAWAFLALFFAMTATGAFLPALTGKTIEKDVVVDRSVGFARRGNRILLNELEEKTKRYVVKTERDATEAEKTVGVIGGSLLSLLVACFLFKVIRPGGDYAPKRTKSASK
jgi:hypothetical protein